ncbi:MAG TPA: 4-(cytidine 5'-diphospho)-2-C-methyl-D-erythritol kinase [Chthoniobacterales bacterium]|jgi:4-diphosphocytidyl-2-C-methyl-D-erythritol kinase
MMQVLAPAKINLSLRVLGRRDDGFHDIETFIAPISLYDELELEKQGQGINFSCDDASVPQREDNLVVRAAKSFFVATRINGGVSIRLTKRIPHGAGLGGGSSDAASTLLALNELFGTGLPREALAKLSESLGSDVPFFVFQSSALCRGRGELISPQRLSDRFSVLLLKPEFAVPTPWAYSRWQDAQEIPGVRYGSQEYGGHSFINELERPVFEKFVFLARLKAWLLDQAEVGAALMSGSGSTVFAVLKDPNAAGPLADRAKQELDPNLWTCACSTV